MLTLTIKDKGFECENYSYPGVGVNLDTLGKKLYQHVKEEGYDTVSFVTHSMGGLVFRSMLKYSGMDTTFPVIFRVVMVAPPNRGAALADYYREISMYHKLVLPNVEKMQTDSTSFVQSMVYPYNIELGIIIGRLTRYFGFNLFIPGDNDGLVKPEHTLLGNETDTITLKLDHFSLLESIETRRMVVYFLRYGTFH